MAHTLRFNGEWQDVNGGMSRFEIYERDFVGEHEEMIMREDPLTLERATLSNKFNPTIGSGVELKVEAAYDGQYAHLYTKDKQKFKARFYKGDKLIWVGYLNSEVYSEQFDRNEGYPVTLQFNDGFTVMERIPYQQENGDAYTGLKTAWDVIWDILDKTDIGYKYLYVACDVYEENMNALSSPFHQMKVDCGNYYDEKGDPMNCREVLEAIVRTQRAICFQNEGCLNIVSVPLLAANSFERRKYTARLSVDPIPAVSVSPLITIPTQADWYASDQALDVVSGYNKATLKYSPYAAEDIYEIDFTDPENWEGDWDWVDVGDYYELQGVTGIKGWNLAAGVTVSGTKEEEIDDPEVYLVLPYEINSDSYEKQVEINIPTPLVTGVNGQGFKIEFKLYAVTKNDEFDDNEESKYVIDGETVCNFEVDGKRHGSFVEDRDWEDVPIYLYVDAGIRGHYTTIADQWSTVTVQVPDGCPHGNVKFQIFKKWNYWANVPDSPLGTDTVKHIRLKNLKISPMDYEIYTGQSGGKYINELDSDFGDLEFVAEMDDDWLNEADDVEMIHGDSKENNCTDKGGLHLLDNSFTGAWKTPADTEYYNIAELYLRSYVSNYQDSLKQLSGTLCAPNFFNGNGENIDEILSFHSVLTYPSTSLGSKKLMFMGGTYNDKRQTLNGTWLEVLADDLTINTIE